MFDANIQGVYKELVENEKMVMKWKFKEWPEFADVVVNFTAFNDSCEINVSYTNIPTHDNFGNHIHIESIQ